MVSIVFEPAFAIPGQITRAPEKAIIEPSAFNASLPFPGYGLPGKIVSNAFVPVVAGADVVYGFLVRPFPTQGVNASDPLGTAVPPTTGEADVMVFGYLGVKCNAGTPVQGGAVYVRYANGSSGTPVGGIEATSVPGTNFVIANAQFQGPADANGNCEIRLDI